MQRNNWSKGLAIFLFALVFGFALIGCGSHSEGGGNDSGTGGNPPPASDSVTARVVFTFAELDGNSAARVSALAIAYPDFYHRREMAEALITAGKDVSYCVKVVPLDASNNPINSQAIWKPYTKAESLTPQTLFVPVGKVRVSAFVFDGDSTDPASWPRFISLESDTTIVSGSNPTLPILLRVNPDQSVSITVNNFPASVANGNALSIYDSAISNGTNGGATTVTLPDTNYTGVFNFASEKLEAVVTLADTTTIKAVKPFSFAAYFLGSGPEIIDFTLFAQTQAADISLPAEWAQTIYNGHDDVLANDTAENFDPVKDAVTVIAGETWQFEIFDADYLPSGQAQCSGVVITLKDSADTVLASTTADPAPRATLTHTFAASGSYKPYRTMRNGATGNFYRIKATKVSNP